MTTYRLCSLRSQTAWDAMSTAEQSVYDVNYTTLVDFWTTEATDLVTSSLGDIILECYNDWPAGMEWGFTDDFGYGWSTNDDNCLIVKAAEGQGHNGIVGDGFFILGPASTAARVRKQVRYKGISFKGTDTTSINPYGYNGVIQLEGCILYDMYYPRLNIAGSYAKNCIFYNNLRYMQTSIVPFYKCLFYKTTAFTGDGRVLRDAKVYDCIGWVESPSNYNIFYNCTGSNNIANDGSGPQALPELSDMAWTDSVNGDFSISSDSILYNKGDSIDGIDEDILGTARPQGISDDIGPFEALVPPPTLTISGSVSLVGAEIRIYDMDNIPSGSLGTELSGVESNTIATYEYSGTQGNDMWLQIMLDGYEEFGQKITMPSYDSEFEAVLQVDNNL